MFVLFDHCCNLLSIRFVSTSAVHPPPSSLCTDRHYHLLLQNVDEKFIPISISDLIYLIALRIDNLADQNKFVKFARHLCYHIHVALYDEFLIAQKSYQSQDPDRDTQVCVCGTSYVTTCNRRDV